MNVLKKATLLAVAVLTGFYVYADMNAINDALNQGQSEFKDTFNSIKWYVVVVAAIIGIVNAVKCYSKMQEGDREAGGKIAWWVGGVVFFFFALFLVDKLFINR